MTYLMNPETGTVASHEEWISDFNASTPEEWGGETFEDAALLEVVENVEGQEGYDPEYGDWRPADDDLPANSASDDLDQWDPEICPCCPAMPLRRIVSASDSLIFISFKRVSISAPQASGKSQVDGKKFKTFFIFCQIVFSRAFSTCVSGLFPSGDEERKRYTFFRPSGRCGPRQGGPEILIDRVCHFL